MKGLRGTCFDCSSLGNLSVLTAQTTKFALRSVSNAPRPRASAARLTLPLAPPLGIVPQAFAGAGEASSAPARGLTPADCAIVMPPRSLTAATQRRSDANEASSGASFSISCPEKWISSTYKQVSGAAEPPASVVQSSAPAASAKTTDEIALEAYAIHFRTPEIAFTPCAIHFRVAAFHFLAAATEFRTP